MGFIRTFEQAQIQKMTSGDNAELFAKLKADILKGEVFPAVRKNELYFYYKGGCLYKFSCGSFKRDKNFEKFGEGLEGISSYEKVKKENEIKFTNVGGKAKERQLLDELNRHTFNRNYGGNVVVLDIEVNLNGELGRGKKCDLVLLNTQTDELMFVEGKVFSDSRVNVKPPNIPEVIEQVNTYSAAIAEQRQVILEQYARHIEIINGLFGTSYRPPIRLVEPAKLLVYETPEIPNKNGEHSIDKIKTELGTNTVLWVKERSKLTLDDIWNSLNNEPEIVVFDLETTGSKCEEDFIIEIGAVKLKHGRIVDEFHSYVSCPQKLSEEVERLTGILNSDIAHAPTINEVLGKFNLFADDCILAAYNLSFDWKFIKHNADLCELNFENDKIDILSLIQRKLQGQINTFKLSTVAAHYGIKLKQHSILDAAKIAAEIMLKFMS